MVKNTPHGWEVLLLSPEEKSCVLLAAKEEFADFELAHSLGPTG